MQWQIYMFGGRDFILILGEYYFCLFVRQSFAMNSQGLKLEM